LILHDLDPSSPLITHPPLISTFLSESNGEKSWGNQNQNDSFASLSENNNSTSSAIINNSSMSAKSNGFSEGANEASSITTTTTTTTTTSAAAAPASKDSGANTSPAPKSAIKTFQAAARAVIAGNKFIEALTADVEKKVAKDQVESVESSITVNDLKQSMSKAKTQKAKRRQTLFGVTSSFIAAYKASKTTGDVVETVEESRHQVVSIGSIPALIDAFTTPADLNMEYLLEFLATHRFFMTSIKLLQHLINRHNDLSNENLNNKWKDLMQVRILKIIRIWITRHPADFGLDSIIERSLKSFLQNEASEGEKQYVEVENILNLIEEKNKEAKKKSGKAEDSAENEGENAGEGEEEEGEKGEKSGEKIPKRLQRRNSTYITDPNLLMACPETLVAEQLTLIESQLFKVRKQEN